MAKYDSILKEQKTYQQPTTPSKKKKSFPYLLLDVICTLIILIVSYIIYYRTVLAPDKIFLSDISTVLTQYQEILKYLPLEELTSNYNFEGTLSLDEEQYPYSLIKNNDNLKIELSNKENKLSYHLDSNNHYLNLTNFSEDYIIMNKSNSLNEITPIKNNFLNTITEDRYVKKLYLDGTTPIVEVNLTLKNDQINNIMKTTLKEQYTVILTFKNNALTSEIISLKASINNLASNKRTLVTYQDGIVSYSNDEEQNLKFRLTKNNEDFSLKIYQNDILYSVLTGTKLEDSYQYLYQIIDKIYNVSLNITKEDTNYTCKIISNIDADEVINKKEVSLTINQKEDVTLDTEPLSNIKNYKDLTKEEKETLKKELNNITDPLRKLIKEYQTSIN